MKLKYPVILASASPRRKELLSGMGISFDVRVPQCEEIPLPKEDPVYMAERFAREKAWSLAEEYPDALVIGSDTVVICQGEYLGKPTSVCDAKRMLRLLSGQSHQVVTAVALVQKTAGIDDSFVESTQVTMRGLSDEEIKNYIASSEPFGKAGSYAIQGKGRDFVAKIEGDFSNVVGFPTLALEERLRILGLETTY